MTTDHAALARELTKDTKKKAEYTDNGRQSEHCGHVNGWKTGECRYYVTPNHCEKVEGYISPRGWCRHWTKK